MAEVLGKDGIVFFNVSGTFKEFGCAETITYESNAEIIETTTEGTGVSRTFDYQSLSYSISLSGLVLNVDTNVTVWDMLEQQRMFLTTPFRIIYTDRLGNVKVISGNVVIPNISLTADQTDLASSSLQLQGSGGLGVDEVPVPTITISVTGAGVGHLNYVTFSDPSSSFTYTTAVGPHNIGTTITVPFDGFAGRPPSGVYHVEVSVTSDEPDNTLSTDAPPTASITVGAGTNNLINSAPFGNSVLYDFTQDRTITFNVGS